MFDIEAAESVFKKFRLNPENARNDSQGAAKAFLLVMQRQRSIMPGKGLSAVYYSLPGLVDIDERDRGLRFACAPGYFIRASLGLEVEQPTFKHVQNSRVGSHKNCLLLTAYCLLL